MRKVFKHTGETFAAYHDATNWCKTQGWFVSTMCWPSPSLAFTREALETWGARFDRPIIVPKFDRLHGAQREQAIAEITATNRNDFREGDVTVAVKEDV